MKKRSSGILLHISSLPSDYGIGDLGKEAYKFVDFLVAAKQKYWQILPIGITGFGDSPYKSFSAFAGNPYFIDLEELIELGYLTKNRIQDFELSKSPDKVDYGLVYENRMEILRIAYEIAKKEMNKELKLFYKENYYWLRDFAVFMSIKTKSKGTSWLKWNSNYKNSKSKEVMNFEKNNEDEIYFWIFTQYLFVNQWEKLKKYANKKGIHIIGDLPIYVSDDSSDLWANPHLFNLDKNYNPITVAGVPPDDYASKGQLWGNPIYNWKAIEDEGYKWWIQRIKHSFTLYDALRIDHFRGFESYWEVKYGSQNAKNGKWVKGPGIKLFKKVKKELGDLHIIAEDLGYITDEVKKLIKDTGFPSMKVLQFAFNSNEDNIYLPHNYNKNSVVYTGTHDNSTILGFVKRMIPEDLHHAEKYFKLSKEEGYNWGFIRGAWSSRAYLAIAPMQDFLGLDDRARMNKPSTIDGNWTWRMEKSSLTEELAKRIKGLTNIYRR